MKAALADFDGQAALSLIQPWASALFLMHNGQRLKEWETRSWRTSFRGPLLIHAAKGYPGYAKRFAEEERALGRGQPSLPFGAIIGRVFLREVYHTADIVPSLSALERRYGDYTPGRFAWKTVQPELFDDPIPCVGHLGIWRVRNAREDVHGH